MKLLNRQIFVLADSFKIKIHYFDYGPMSNLEIISDSTGKKTKINSKF